MSDFKHCICIMTRGGIYGPCEIPVTGKGEHRVGSVSNHWCDPCFYFNSQSSEKVNNKLSPHFNCLSDSARLGEVKIENENKNKNKYKYHICILSTQ